MRVIISARKGHSSPDKFITDPRPTPVSGGQALGSARDSSP